LLSFASDGPVSTLQTPVHAFAAIAGADKKKASVCSAGF
jgi:hypothetical protein